MFEGKKQISSELDFLARVTGEDELTLLSRARDLGLDLLYRQIAEQAYIDDKLTHEESAAILGSKRVEDLDYAKEALAEDVKRGWAL